MLQENDVVVSTTGMISRELYEIREQRGQGHQQDFLTVGSMGHSLAIAQGISAGSPNQIVYCLDGDGSMLMHMGSLAIVGQKKPSNLKHIILNNAAHDSVGGQPTAAENIDLSVIAGACGYSWTGRAAQIDEIKGKLKEFSQSHGPSFFEIKVRKGNREDLGRPKTSPVENKNLLMKFIQEG